MEGGLNTGVRGATKLSWDGEATLRQWLSDILATNPGISRDESFKLFLARLEEEDGDSYSPASGKYSLAMYFHTNHYRYIVQPTSFEQKARERAAKKAVESARVEEVKIALKDSLLEWIMPNGKPLGECTGVYCAQRGGWLAKVGAKAGSKKIAEVFSAAQLKAFRGK